MTSRPSGANVRRLAKLIDGGQRGVYAVDPRRRLVYINGPLAEFLAVEPEQVVGKVLQFGQLYDSDPLIEKLSRLAPPPCPVDGDRRPIKWQITLPAIDADLSITQLPAFLIPISDPASSSKSALLSAGPDDEAAWLGIVWLPMSTDTTVGYTTDGTAGWDPQISELGPADLQIELDKGELPTSADQENSISLLHNEKDGGKDTKFPKAVIGKDSITYEVGSGIVWQNDIELNSLLASLRSQHRSLDELWPLLGKSSAIVAAMQQTQLSLKCNANVLISGPVGVGKQLIAKAIFALRLRELGQPSSSGNLVVVDCSLMDRDILAGMLELIEPPHTNRWTADNQMLILNGLDRLAPVCIPQLLDWLQHTNQVRIVGTIASRQLATGSTTLDSIEDNSAPLPYPEFDSILKRIGIIQIDLPALADRPGDISLLATYFLAEARRTAGKGTAAFTSAAMELLETFPWRGNTVQLKEIVHRSLPDSGAIVDVHHLPIAVRSFRESANTAGSQLPAIELDSVLATVEKELIQRALSQSGGNRAQAARLLGISRPRLLRSIQQLLPAEYRSGAEASDDEAK